ncbi:hypothetical protein DMB66_01255 [Actinoplanes sp. ATCC 53533]|uniref:hypothetical protein n=1 Tax=Actinoplanes sp. ATCC 53533 TaxID=1288362 RepID=UPI000F787C97|nr:hypothetical protein [Actinoplanes sp. ATCC 53533]RSM74093.1 hypothetical protein DMB66_01255 [Actinoplanes sp. ATCC 53533]
MTTPWQLHQDLIRVTEAEIAHTSRHASQLAELRLSAGDRRRRVGAVLGALFRSRRIRPRSRASGPLGVADAAPENRLESTPP